MSPVRGASIAAAALLAATAVLSAAATPSSGHAVARSAWLAPAGSGSRCTRAKPCGDLTRALIAAGPGGRVLLRSGRYGNLTVPRLSATDGYSANVRVQPAPKATPVLGNVRTAAAHVTWSRLDAASFYFTSTATWDVLRRSHVHGSRATVIVRGSHVAIRRNLIEGGHAHDGLNIAGWPKVNTDIRIVGNTIRDFTEGTPAQQHADCIQLFDTSHVRIERNNVYDCYDSGIIFTSGNRLGISSVAIESNFVQGCVAGRQRCGNGASADLRYPSTGVSVIHNSFDHGLLMLPATGNLRASSNIVSYLFASGCANPLTDSLIGYNLPWKCPGAVPGTRNRKGTVSYVNPGRGNLHLTRTPAGVTQSSSTALDIDGQRFTSTVPGADQPSG